MSIQRYIPDVTAHCDPTMEAVDSDPMVETYVKYDDHKEVVKIKDMIIDSAVEAERNYKARIEEYDQLIRHIYIAAITDFKADWQAQGHGNLQDHVSAYIKKLEQTNDGELL